MSHLKHLTAAALGVATLAAPALALAVGSNELRGAPQIRLVDGQQAKLTFTTDDRLTRSASGRYRVRIEFLHGRGVSSAVYDGRHGNDYRYSARLSSSHELQTGRKYNVRFTFPGQKPVTRLVKVHAAKG